MIRLFCCVSGLHHRASRVLGVCEGYESVGDVSEDGLRLHHVHLFAFALTFFVVLACVCVAVGVVVCTSSWSPAIFHPMSSSAHSSCKSWHLYCLCECLANFGVCLGLSHRPCWETPPATCCHHQHLFRSLLMLSSAHIPRCKLFLTKIGAMFIITVYWTASARGVPEARSDSPTSNSQVLKPDSNPSVCSHQRFTGIMIFDIKAY